MKTKKDIIAHF